MDNRRPRPRRRYTAEQRDEFVRLYRQCDLTQADFARQQNLRLCTLSRWIHQRAKQAARSPGMVFEGVELPTRLLAPAVEIIVGADISLRLGAQSSPEFIAQVIRQLRRPC